MAIVLGAFAVLGVVMRQSPVVQRPPIRERYASCTYMGQKRAAQLIAAHRRWTVQRVFDATHHCRYRWVLEG